MIKHVGICVSAITTTRLGEFTEVVVAPVAGLVDFIEVQKLGYSFELWIDLMA